MRNGSYRKFTCLFIILILSGVAFTTIVGSEATDWMLKEREPPTAVDVSSWGKIFSVTDPAGDVNKTWSPRQNSIGNDPPHCDIKSFTSDCVAADFTFKLNLGGAVPEANKDSLYVSIDFYYQCYEWNDEKGENELVTKPGEFSYDFLYGFSGYWYFYDTYDGYFEGSSMVWTLTDWQTNDGTKDVAVHILNVSAEVIDSSDDGKYTYRDVGFKGGSASGSPYEDDEPPPDDDEEPTYELSIVSDDEVLDLTAGETECKITATLLDGDGKGVEGKTITFSVTDEMGSISSSAVTDTDGKCSVTYSAPDNSKLTSGTQWVSVDASCTDCNVHDSVSFTLHLTTDVTIKDVKIIQVLEDVPIIYNKWAVVRVWCEITSGKQGMSVDAVLKDSNGNTIQEKKGVFIKKDRDEYDLNEKLKGKDSINFYFIPNDLTGLRLGAGSVTYKVEVYPSSARDADSSIRPSAEAPVTAQVKRQNTVFQYETIPVAIGNWYDKYEKGQTVDISSLVSTTDSFLMAMYPFAENWVKQMNTNPAASKLHYPGWLGAYSFKQMDKANLIKVLNELVVEYNRVAQFDHIDRYVGVVPSDEMDDLGLSLPSYKKAVLISETATGPTMAHEIGHTFHVEGTTTLDHMPDSPGTSNKADAGFWVESFQPRDSSLTNQLKMSYSYSDFMNTDPVDTSSCWISEKHYLELMQQIAPSSRGTRQHYSDVLMLSGTLDSKDNIELDPPVVVRNGKPDYEPAGDYTIECYSGSTISSTFYFTPHSFEGSDDSSFFRAIPYGGSETKVIIKHGDDVLKEITRSSNAPSITITSSVSGELSGTYSLAWEGTDTDGDELTYSVQFSNDGGYNWRALAMDISDTSLDVDVDSLDGGASCYFRITASDGFNTHHVDSTGFSVANREPELVILPAEGGGLSVEVYDDGPVDQEDIVWESDRDGVFATGSSASTDGLSSGDHRITVTVTDAMGDSSSSGLDTSVEEGPDPTDEEEINGTGSLLCCMGTFVVLGGILLAAVIVVIVIVVVVLPKRKEEEAAASPEPPPPPSGKKSSKGKKEKPPPPPPDKKKPNKPPPPEDG